MHYHICSRFQPPTGCLTNLHQKKIKLQKQKQKTGMVVVWWSSGEPLCGKGGHHKLRYYCIWKHNANWRLISFLNSAIEFRSLPWLSERFSTPINWPQTKLWNNSIKTLNHEPVWSSPSSIASYYGLTNEVCEHFSLCEQITTLLCPLLIRSMKWGCISVTSSSVTAVSVCSWLR